MTLIVELPPELESRLKSQAERRGLDPQAYVRKLIEADVPVDVELQKQLNQSTLDLFAKWAAEDATDDPEEIARRERDFNEFKEGMNQAKRDSDGPNARIPFP